MSLRILIDMNLSPDWAPPLQQQGWVVAHWSGIGDPRAPDREIMAWALANNHVVFTHDLDFGNLLAATRAGGPSVVQLRTQDVLPDRIAQIVITSLRQHEVDLTNGALMTIDESRMRIRILPI